VPDCDQFEAPTLLSVGMLQSCSHSSFCVPAVGQLSGRPTGGFLEPIDLEKLQEAVRGPLATSSLGEFEAIKSLPGMVRAAVNALEKVSRAPSDAALGRQTRQKLSTPQRVASNPAGNSSHLCPSGVSSG